MTTAGAPETIWHADPHVIGYRHGPETDLVIAFSSVGHDPGRLPSPEFQAATGRMRAMFVMDASRSWGLDAGFVPALRAGFAKACERGPVARVLAMGLSMGGFAALRAAQILPVDVVLAFGPQYSIAPDFGEARWAEWTLPLAARLARDESGAGFDPAHGVSPAGLTATLPDHGWTCLFHGAVDDLRHALAFPRAAGVDQVIFADQTHASLMPHLKARGVLTGLIEAALSGDRRRLLRIAASAGGQRRKA